MTALNDHYGFTQTPFSRSIAPTDLFPAHGHQEIQGRLTFALQERLPALITGDPQDYQFVSAPVSPLPYALSSTPLTATFFRLLIWPTPISR